MKKIYIAPKTENVNIEVESMIAESDPTAQVFNGTLPPNQAETKLREMEDILDFDF